MEHPHGLITPGQKNDPRKGQTPKVVHRPVASPRQAPRLARAVGDGAAADASCRSVGHFWACPERGGLAHVARSAPPRTKRHGAVMWLRENRPLAWRPRSPGGRWAPGPPCTGSRRSRPFAPRALPRHRRVTWRATDMTALLQESIVVV